MSIYSVKNLQDGKAKLIPGTGFMSKQLETQIYSRKNTIPSRVTGTIQMTLNEKVVKAIVNSQNENYNVFAGYGNNGKKQFLGIFDNGDRIDYISYDEDGNNFIMSDDKSYLLALMVLITDRYMNPNDEIDENFRMIRFGDIIDSDQYKQVCICSDGIFYTAQEMFNRKEVDVLRNGTTTQDLSKIKEIVKYMSEDITAYGINDYTTKENTNAVSYIGIDISRMKLEKPAEKELPKTEKELLEEYKTKDFTILSEEEIKLMPETLQDAYYVAREAYNQNKDFFTIREWQLVEQIKNKSVESVCFIGPAGVGKTTTIRAIAGALGLPFVLVGGSSGIEEADLFGYQSLMSESGVSVMKWIDGPVTMAIRYGAFLLLDEVNATDPGVIMKLNTILDGSKIITLSNAESLKVHPNFKYAEAMNLGSGYNGTDKMNLSHFDRIDQIYKITSKKIEEEARIIQKATGYENLNNLKMMCTIKNEIARMIDSDGDDSEMIISPRRLIQWVKKASQTGEFIESSLNTVISHLSIYDDSIHDLQLNEVLDSSTIASTALLKITEAFNGIRY